MLANYIKVRHTTDLDLFDRIALFEDIKTLELEGQKVIANFSYEIPKLIRAASTEEETSHLDILINHVVLVTSAAKNDNLTSIKAQTCQQLLGDSCGKLGERIIHMIVQSLSNCESDVITDCKLASKFVPHISLPKVSVTFVQLRFTLV